MALPVLASIAPLDWSRWETRHLFFTGKGGVGKTTTASGAALALADSGQRTLLVSTDPASNLDDVFGLPAGNLPVEVPGAPNLSVVNLDPEEAAAAYRERTLAPYRGVLPDAAVRDMEEQLSGACTVEIAAFNEFTSVLADPEVARGFDRVLFDTAPTGHTLRLLSLPSAWSGFVEVNPAGASCLGPLAGLERQQQQYLAAVTTLSDPAQTTLVLVTRAEPSALREAARASRELAQLGVRNQRLVVNGLLREGADDPTGEAFLARQRQALDSAPEALRPLALSGVDLVPGDVTGLEALRQLTGAPAPAPAAVAGADDELPPLADLGALVDDLDRAGTGVVLTMGKGGVGKTTTAAALAVALADRGHDVVLSTTDPAAHLTDALAEQALSNLTVDRIDPAAETARYAAEVLDAAGQLDAEGRALLEEDLRSPCTEEIAVFRAFARTVGQATDRIVVLDTAPTGHTLLLLDAAQSYQREVQRTNADVPAEVAALVERLRDPEFARIVVVTLAESTPVHEADRLQTDLRRAGIEPYGWLVNASLLKTGTAHPVLATRATGERRHLRRVAELSAARTWWVGWQPQPPVGAEALRQLAGDQPHPAPA